MPHPERHVESTRPPLGAALHAVIARPALREFLRASLQIRDLSCALGLPRRGSPRAFRQGLVGPHVYLVLGSGAQFDAALCEVALPAEQALELVERVLGGTGHGVVPGPTGVLNAAECGVLAYFVARCLRASGADLRVQDVRCELRAAGDDQSLLWPVRLRAADGLKLDLKLIFAPRARWPAERVSARLSLSETLAAGELAQLGPGDLLVGDDWSLHVTAAGVTGLVELSVAGSDERARLLLEGAEVRLSDEPLAAPPPDCAELVLAELALDCAQLADLLSGARVACPTPCAATLVARGETLARGRLVRYGGQLALLVEARGSTREQSLESHSTR